MEEDNLKRQPYQPLKHIFLLKFSHQKISDLTPTSGTLISTWFPDKSDFCRAGDFHLAVIYNE
ncbi:hypothetical protein QJS10_CPB14g01200 [Acorus calamus]|uniref:Uncharacterized protein n=1 Tax=Acorus calamus TaxID=4465 RepID=A0AAV9DA41_ACOCL|nr:hypothetical protein QJS10_CPB14g01200 [Acorus calamus]